MKNGELILINFGESKLGGPVMPFMLWGHFDRCIIQAFGLASDGWTQKAIKAVESTPPPSPPIS